MTTLQAAAEVHQLFKSPDMENFSSNNQHLGKQLIQGVDDEEHQSVQKQLTS